MTLYFAKRNRLIVFSATCYGAFQTVCLNPYTKTKAAGDLHSQTDGFWVSSDVKESPVQTDKKKL